MTTLQAPNLSDFTGATRAPSGLDDVFRRLIETASWDLDAHASFHTVIGRPASMVQITSFDSEPGAVRWVRRVAVTDSDEW